MIVKMPGHQKLSRVAASAGATDALWYVMMPGLEVAVTIAASWCCCEKGIEKV